jgi:hypothetical protein
VTIVSDACTINDSFVFALALASVVNYAREWRHSLGASLADDSRVIIYDHNMFVVQAIVVQAIGDQMTQLILMRQFFNWFSLFMAFLANLGLLPIHLALHIFVSVIVKS